LKFKTYNKCISWLEYEINKQTNELTNHQGTKNIWFGWLITFITFKAIKHFSAENPTGLVMDIVKLLQERMGFKLNIWPAPDGKWGAKTKDGTTWNGMVGELQKKAVDFTHPLTRNIERSKVMEFSIGVITDMYTLIIPKPRGVVPSVWGYIVIFTWEAWFFILFLMVLAAINLLLRYAMTHMFDFLFT